MLPSGLTALTPSKEITPSPRSNDTASGQATATQDDFASLIEHSVKRRQSLDEEARQVDRTPSEAKADDTKSAKAAHGIDRRQDAASLEDQMADEGVDEPPEVDVTPLSGNAPIVADPAQNDANPSVEDADPQALNVSTRAPATQDPLQDAASIAPVMTTQTDIMAAGQKPNAKLEQPAGMNLQTAVRPEQFDLAQARQLQKRVNGAEPRLETGVDKARRGAEFTLSVQQQGSTRPSQEATNIGARRNLSFNVMDTPVTARSQADIGLQHALTHFSAAGSTPPDTTAMTTDTLPPVDSEQWDNALAAQIRHMGRAGHGQSVLTLSPASLGSLEVNLDINAQQQAHVHFVTQTDAAHDALSSSMESLQHALTQQGVDLQRMSVQHRPDTQTAMGFAFGQGSGEQPQQQYSSARHSAYARSNDAVTTDNSDDPSPITAQTVNRVRATA